MMKWENQTTYLIRVQQGGQGTVRRSKKDFEHQIWMLWIYDHFWYVMIGVNMPTYTSAIEEGMFSSTHFRSSSWKINIVLFSWHCVFYEEKKDQIACRTFVWVSANQRCSRCLKTKLVIEKKIILIRWVWTEATAAYLNCTCGSKTESSVPCAPSLICDSHSIFFFLHPHP